MTQFKLGVRKIAVLAPNGFEQSGLTNRSSSWKRLVQRLM
jgi:hypothetical protein